MNTIAKTSTQSIWPLLWIMLFDHTSLNIAFPVLTLLFFDAQSSLFHADTSHAVRSMWYGLCVAIPHIFNIVMSPILSGLSDEFGRKKILLLGTLGAFLFALTAALSIVWGLLGLLFFGRIIQGAFSRTNPIAQAIVGDISSPVTKMRNMGYVQSAISIGAFLGPLLGGYFAASYFFAALNFSLPYFIATLFAAMSCILTLFTYTETLTTKRKEGIKWHHFSYPTIKKVITNPHVLRISTILLLSQIGWSMYYQFIPPVLKTVLGFNAHGLGIFVGMIAFWLTLATTFGIRFLDSFFSLRQMLFLSLYLVFVGLLMTALFGLWKSDYQMFFIWFSAIPTAIGDVIAYSCLITLYSDLVDKDEQGKVMGVCFIIIGLIWSSTGMLGGLLMSVYALLPLIIAPIGVLLAIGLLHSRFSYSLWKH